MEHDGDGILHMLQGCLPYVEELTSWLMMILVESYRDGMLSRTKTISGGGGCKAFATRAGERRARDMAGAHRCDERENVRRAGAPWATKCDKHPSLMRHKM